MATRDADPPDDDSVLAEMAAAVATPVEASWQGSTKAEDRYEVGELLGKGGMAVVHRARDLVLGRVVALKFVRDASPLIIVRLEREARALARVDHPNICPIYDVGELDGKPFIAMPCIEGRPLGEVELSLADKARVMRDVARAVHAAHQAGVIHRDLKPANILVERGEGGGLKPYVMDFGIAREADDRTLTLTGQMLGTPQYMAPEQADGRRGDVDARTDVWALGATLYELLAGAPPFPAESVPQLLLQISAADPPPVRRRAPEVPVALETIAMRCLRREPAARYPSAEALADDLERYLADQPIAARPASLVERTRTRLRRHPARSAAVAALVLGAGGAAAFFLVGRKKPPSSWRPAVVDLAPFFDENSNGVAISPDGRRMVYDSDRDGTTRVYLAPIEGGSDRAISPAGVTALKPSFTRDGLAVLYSTDRDEVFRQPLDGGAPTRIAEGARDAVDCGRGLLFDRNGPTGDCFDCRRITLRTTDGRERDIVRFGHLQWTYGLDCDRDGRHALYGWQSDDGGGRVVMVDLAGGEPLILAADHDRADRPRFHPDGTSVLFGSARGGARNLWEQPISGGAARQITTGGGPDVTAAVTPDGRRLIYDVDVSFAPVMAMPITGGAPRRVSAALEHVDWLDLAPDGRELVLEAERDRDHVIAILSLETGEERVLSAGSRPIFSDDGSEVLYLQGGRLLAMPRAGGSPRTLADVPGAEEIFGAADSVYLLTASNGRVRVWRVPYQGGTAEEVTRPGPWIAELPLHGGWRAVWRPDAGFVLLPPGVEPGAPGARAIGRRYFAGRHTSIVLYFKGDEVHRLDLQGGEDRKVAVLPRLLLRAFGALSPDGTTFYYSVVTGQVRRQVITNFADRPR